MDFEKNKFLSKKNPAKVCSYKKNTYLCTRKRKATEKLPCGVMVARRILVPPVRVRILPRQQREELSHNDLALFVYAIVHHKSNSAIR